MKVKAFFLFWVLLLTSAVSAYTVEGNITEITTNGQKIFVFNNESFNATSTNVTYTSIANSNNSAIGVTINSSNDSGSFKIGTGNSFTGATTSYTSANSFSGTVVTVCEANLISTSTGTRVCGLDAQSGTNLIRFWWNGTTLWADSVLNGAFTSTNLTLFADGTHTFKIVRFGTTKSIFYLDGAIFATHTTNIPILPLYAVTQQESGSAFTLTHQRIGTEIPNGMTTSVSSEGSGSYNVPVVEFTDANVSANGNDIFWNSTQVDVDNGYYDGYWGFLSNAFNENASVSWKYVAPTGFNITNCGIWAKALTQFGATPRWVNTSYSTNGGVTFTENGGTTLSQTFQNFPTGAINTNELIVKYLLKTINERPYLTGLGLNCSLTNTTTTNLPVIVSGNNSLNFYVVSGSHIDSNVSVGWTSDNASLFIYAINPIGANWTNFNVNLTSIVNSSLSLINSTTNGLIKIQKTSLWTGLTNLTITGSGLNTTYTTINLPTDTTIHSIENVTVYPANLVFSAFDETNLSSINVTVTLVNATNTTIITNNTLNLGYNQVPTGAVTVSVSNSGYETRTYFITLNANTAVNLTSYLIPSNAQSSLTRFHIQDSSGGAIVGARVDLRKFITSNFVTVGQAVADDSGTASIFTNVLTQYQIIVSATGYQTTNFSIVPTSQDYFVTMVSSGVSTFNTMWDNLSIELTPYIFNESVDNQNVSLNIVSLDNALSTATLTLFYENGTILYNNTLGGSPSGGQISVIVNKSGKDSLILAKVDILKTNFNTYSFNRTYAVMNFSGHRYNLNNAFAGVGASGAGFTDFTKWFIAILISILVTGWAAVRTPNGWTPVIATLTLAFFTGLIVGWESVLIMAAVIAVGWLLLRQVGIYK